MRALEGTCRLSGLASAPVLLLPPHPVPRPVRCGLCSLASPHPACLPVLLLLLLCGGVAEHPGLLPSAGLVFFSQSLGGKQGNRTEATWLRKLGRGPLWVEVMDPRKWLVWSCAQTGGCLGLGLSDPLAVTVIHYSRKYLK